MLKKYLFLALCCCMGLLAWAQSVAAPAIGKTLEVRGLVTVSDGNVVRTARSGDAVVNGSRVVTSSNGSVRIRRDDGCEVDLKPNQSVIVDDDRDCEGLIASIQSLDGPRFAFIPAGDIAGGLLVLIGGAWLISDDSTSTTPTSPGGGGPEVPFTPE